MLCKCDDEERELIRIQRGVGWCEAQAEGFLLTFRAVFSKPHKEGGREERSASVMGQSGIFFDAI